MNKSWWLNWWRKSVQSPVGFIQHPLKWSPCLCPNEKLVDSSVSPGNLSQSACQSPIGQVPYFLQNLFALFEWFGNWWAYAQLILISVGSDQTFWWMLRKNGQHNTSDSCKMTLSMNQSSSILGQVFACNTDPLENLPMEKHIYTLCLLGMGTYALRVGIGFHDYHHGRYQMFEKHQRAMNPVKSIYLNRVSHLCGGFNMFQPVGRLGSLW